MRRLLPGISSLLICTLPIHSPAFSFQNLSRVFPALVVANTGSCVDPQTKIGHPAGCRFPMLSARGIEIGSKTCVIVFLGLRSETVDRIWAVVWEKEGEKKTCGITIRGMNNMEIHWSLCSALMQSFVVDRAQSTDLLTNSKVFSEFTFRNSEYKDLY